MKKEEVHLILLDIMMPNLDGIRATRKIRETSSVPIIMLSAKSEDVDKILGLNIGADDYITKPFVISEVIARVRAVLRRSQVMNRLPAAEPAAASIYEHDVVFKGLRIDRNAKRCFLDGEPVNLTKTEFSILLFFLTHSNRVYSRDEIIREVWNGDVVVTNRTIDTNITRLRKKIGDYGRNIITRPGFGYGFKETD